MKVEILLTFALLSMCYAGFVSNALGSDMVLQRAPQQARIWGWSKSANSVITINFNNKVFQTNTDNVGKWSFKLPATNAGMISFLKPRTLAIKKNNVLPPDSSRELHCSLFCCLL
jgi:hypothetical protein